MRQFEALVRCGAMVLLAIAAAVTAISFAAEQTHRILARREVMQRFRRT